MTSYVLPICLFCAVLAIVSAAPADEKPFECPANEKYYKCELEVCYKICDHLKRPPACPSIAAGCYKPACLCDNDTLRNSEGKCVPINQCYNKSALQHLARCASSCRGTWIACDILKLIRCYNKDGIRIVLQWVPAHIGLRGNEEADQLSKRAVEMGNVTSYMPDYWEYFSRFKSVCFDKWQKYFNEISKEKGIWYKVIQNEPPREPWFDDKDLTRNYVKLALRLRSGHYPSAKFAFLMRKAASPNCDTCNTIEDVQHLLMECVKNKDERESLAREFKLNMWDVGLIQNILAYPKSEKTKRIILWVSSEG